MASSKILFLLEIMFLQKVNPSFASQGLCKLLNSLPDQDIWLMVMWEFMVSPPFFKGAANPLE